MAVQDTEKPEVQPNREERSPRIRVAIVAPSLGILGGQAVQAQRLLDGWKDDPEVEAWLVPVNPVPPGLLRYGTRVKYVRTGVTQLCYWPLLFRELSRADVVHAFSASYSSFLLAPLPAIAAAKVLGKPVVINYRSGEAPDHLRRSAVARAALRACDARVVPSSFLAGVFREHGIGALVVPNTIDLERFAFRPRIPLRPHLVSTRNLEPLYNVACTLHAFRLVQGRVPNASLTIVGDGSQRTALEQLAERLGLRAVRFAGRVAPSDMHRVYADGDIYVQTPDIDNMPSSVLEAFASGTPVVSTAVGGVPAILRDGVHGLLVPAGDHDAVARQVIRLLDDQALANHLAREALASCNDYRWPVVREQWLALYRDLAHAVTPEAVTVTSA